MDNTPYHNRNRLLLKLGFESYVAYLSSQLWDSIRNRVFVRKGRKCCVCSGPATQVHHSKYTKRNLNGKSLKFLYPICAFHHKQVELMPDGSKKPFHKSQKAFRKMKARPKIQKEINSVLSQSYKDIAFDQAMRRWGL